MDDSIISILILTAVIVTAILRSKERPRRQAEESGSEIPSPWGTLTLPEEERPEPKQMPTARQAASRPPAVRVHRQTEKPDAQLPHKPRNHPSAQPERGGKLHPEPQAETLSENGENSPAGEAFDLRRAVVYAEILKPKFDDD